MNYHLTMISGNGKVGPIPVSTSTRETCPTACPFAGNGCYAEHGPLALRWDKVTRGARGVDWEGFLALVRRIPRGQLWRHNQAGDLPGRGDTIDTAQLKQLVDAARGTRGFTYTHKPIDNAHNRAAI